MNMDFNRRYCQQQQCYLLHKFIFHVLAAMLVIMISHSEGYDPLDPTGNITIRWDIMSWTADGYTASVAINNFQMYRSIGKPGWTLGWTWAKKEIIWGMVGAQATEQGDCSKFKLNIPHCCKRKPAVVDLLPAAPFNLQYANCCRGGVLTSWGMDPTTSMSAFQLTVGLSGTSNKTVKLPKDFNLLGPGSGYSCGPAKIVPSTMFLSADGRRKSQALMTWNVTCTYSQFLASKYPRCCVSLSTFYSDIVTPCPSCACGCQNNNSCIPHDLMLLKEPETDTPKKDNSPLLQCTRHMCPIRVHWHVKENYNDYWRAKISITNFNRRLNYSQWTLVAQHPNLNNVTRVYSFEYKPLIPFESINDTGMFYGLKYYNDFIMEAGPFGNVQSEVLMKKDMNTFSFKQGWAFPRKVYFNGDECMLPPPDTYPFLPNSAHARGTSVPYILMLFFFCRFFAFS